MGTNENWMASLPQHVRSMPIINLAIPGTHNSMTYGIKEDAKVGPDADTTTQRFNTITPCIVRRWAITQSVNAEEQLKMGIRYFDLRICQMNGKFYYTHGLLAMEVLEPMECIKSFLVHNPGEIVILDFQHSYAMSAKNHMQMHLLLIELFGSLLYSPEDGALSDCTLDKSQELGRQVVLIYRRCPIKLPPQFWPSYTWPTPWPNLCSTKKLLQYLEESLHYRKPNQGYVSQCIITPSARFVTLRFLSSLRKTAARVDRKLQPWIKSQVPGLLDSPGQPKVNVFIADFVHINGGEFCNHVIALNNKLQ